ncbi:GDSL esterase/lipase EXL2, partial [Mucuna pruriens]
MHFNFISRYLSTNTFFIYLFNIFAVILVSGSNDITNTYYVTGIRNLHFDISTHTDMLVEAASFFFKDLYELGGKDNRSVWCTSTMMLTIRVNVVWRSRKIRLTHIYDSLFDIIQNPAKYGIKKRTCLKYIINLRDLKLLTEDAAAQAHFHPTERTYQILVNRQEIYKIFLEITPIRFRGQIEQTPKKDKKLRKSGFSLGKREKREKGKRKE